MSELAISRVQYLELEKLSIGAFDPVHGFMNEDELRSVVATARLPSGVPFPLPIILPVTREEAERVRGRPRVSLVHDGKEVGQISPENVFTLDKPSVARSVYGTDAIDHPGVRFFIRGGDWFIGGPITLTARVQHDLSRFDLTPAQTRAIFRERGWKTVVGFQTRNVPHRAHEYLQRAALEMVDGLFVQPLVGHRKIGDYTPEAILTGCQTLISQFFPPDHVLLGILTTAMRYAGPREAVFHAIIRRNYGCTHFIVGRDHAGVGNYYGKYSAHEMTRRFDGELGIEIMRLHGPFHCRACEGIATEQTCPHYTGQPEMVSEISGTDIRAVLSNGGVALPHLIRPEVIAALKGIPLFIESEEP
ncbi:MAG: sulfate adenylyltransferase [Proteobacteria bacterium]|nr:sulfate adenylyltransferase [Pseudomonadota bacterium]